MTELGARRALVGLLSLTALAAAAGCVPPTARGHRLTPGGVHADAQQVTALVTVHAQSPTDSDRLFVVTCPRGSDGGVDVGRCWWQPAGQPDRPPPPRASRSASPPAPPSGREQAMAAASEALGCPRARIAVRSDGTRDGVEGYWLLVCDTQRFFQRGRGGQFVDRTP